MNENDAASPLGECVMYVATLYFGKGANISWLLRNKQLEMRFYVYIIAMLANESIK